MSVRSSEFARDPFSYYRSLRETAGIHFLPEEGAWLVVKHGLASSILRQPAVFSSSPFAVLSPSLHGADPPDHTQMRRLLNPYFTPEKQLAQRSSIQRHAAATLDRLRNVKSFDAVTELATPIPLAVTSEWLGLREDLAGAMHQLAFSQIRWEDVKAALRDEGVIPDLVRSSDLTDEKLAELSVFFLVASFGSTRDFILLALSALIDRQDIVAEVDADRSLMPALLDELFRLEPSAHTLIRRTRSEVVLEGQQIPEGSTIWVSIGAANRDPEVYENPDELRLDRTTGRYLTFGLGPHFCLGSPIGRLESEMILLEMLPDIPRLKSVGPPKVQFWSDFPDAVPLSRQIVSWPMTIGAASRSARGVSIANESVVSAISFLESEQLESGQFRMQHTYHAILDPTNGQPTVRQELSPFCTTYITHALGLSDDGRARSMIERALEFLADDEAPGGLWRYWTKDAALYPQVPADVDDTACVSEVLRAHGGATPDNEDFFLLNRARSGLFYTWIVPRPVFSMSSRYWRILLGDQTRGRLFDFWHAGAAKDDIDSVVNANVLLYLGERRETQPVIEYLRDVARTGREVETDRYYRSVAAFHYAVARCYEAGVGDFSQIAEITRRRLREGAAPDGSIFGNVLQTALCVCALLRFGMTDPIIAPAVDFIRRSQASDGGWESQPFFFDGRRVPLITCGSRAVTTGFCLEALQRIEFLQ